MKMHNPPHPGEVLRALCLEPMNLTVTDAARSLGVSRKALSSILNGRAGISPEMAIRLSIAFHTSAESWLNQQVQYDLWHAEKNRKRIHVATRSLDRLAKATASRLVDSLAPIALASAHLLTARVQPGRARCWRYGNDQPLLVPCI
ncbi:MAG: HigA family addiction module antitoxin, partial [Acidobacteriaceae bacterium]